MYALIDNLRETIARQSHQLEQFQRAVFGSSSERLPSVKTQLRKKRERHQTDAERKERDRRAQKRREKNAEKKRKAARKEVVEHPIVDPNCHGFGRDADDASSLADAVVSKCADSLPIERQAKRLRRVGIPMNESTLLDLYHGTASLLRPLWTHLVSDVAHSEDGDLFSFKRFSDHSQIDEDDTERLRSVDHVEIFYPNEALRDVTLIDTTGFGSTPSRMTRLHAHT